MLGAGSKTECGSHQKYSNSVVLFLRGKILNTFTARAVFPNQGSGGPFGSLEKPKWIREIFESSFLVFSSYFNFTIFVVKILKS